VTITVTGGVKMQYARTLGFTAILLAVISLLFYATCFGAYIAPFVALIATILAIFAIFKGAKGLGCVGLIIAAIALFIFILIVIVWTYWLTHFPPLTTSPSSPHPSSSSSKPVPQKPIFQKPLVTSCPVCNGQGGWYVDMPCLYRHIHEGWVTCPTCEGKGKVVCRFCEGTGISGGTIEVKRHLLGKDCGVGFETAHYRIKQGDLRAPCIGCGTWVYACLFCGGKGVLLEECPTMVYFRCERCGGSGVYKEFRKCTTCNGTGKVFHSP
jgi:hypothetical protein